ncbi:MAG TPA: YoaK family protein, partial [Micromonosporaceae bacterium]
MFLLAMVSGATDAIGFVTLGGVFTSVMTGNMVLFGLGVARGDSTLLANAATAIVAFIVGCAIGARIAGRPESSDPPWPRQVTLAVLFELSLFALYAIGYELADRGHPNSAEQPVLLALTAIGLGLQSAAVQRFGQSGLSTTYMTGTLTTLVARLATGGSAKDAVPNLRLLIGLIGGAIAGGALAVYARPFAPVFQLALLVAVLVIANLRNERRA